ncbi:MAG: hypothetical protein AAF808_04220 [Cyanobacteria bacterium P01_D01_bin.2]
MNTDTAALAARLQSELSDLEQIVKRAQKLLTKAVEQDADYYDGVALNLHSFYTGAERILEEIAKEIDDSVPDGAGWHRNLLMQVSAELSSIRPAVISRGTRHCLDEYRGLIHIVQNIYTFNLRPSRLRELVTDLPRCYGSLKADIDSFCVFLNELAADPE